MKTIFIFENPKECNGDIEPLWIISAGRFTDKNSENIVLRRRIQYRYCFGNHEYAIPPEQVKTCAKHWMSTEDDARLYALYEAISESQKIEYGDEIPVEKGFPIPKNVTIYSTGRTFLDDLLELIKDENNGGERFMADRDMLHLLQSLRLYCKVTGVFLSREEAAHFSSKDMRAPHFIGK